MIWMTQEGFNDWCKFCNDFNIKYLLMFEKDYKSIIYKNY